MIKLWEDKQEALNKKFFIKNLSVSYNTTQVLNSVTLDIKENEIFGIIGPANSGAALETIASGRPYFPVSLKPNAINKHYISGLPVFEDLGSLRKGLESGTSMDQKEFFENFTSLKEFPNSPQRTWDVIEEIVTGEPISSLQ